MISTLKKLSPKNLKRRFFFDLRGYEFTPEASSTVTDLAIKAAASIADSDRLPTIMIHGVMPRSGTNYAASVIELHPDLQSNPLQVYELPFIDASEELRVFHKRFLSFYARNREKMGEHDLLPVFGAAMLKYFDTGINNEKRLLMKVPSVRHLSHFRTIFPRENLLLLMRDGRDVVASYSKTFSAQYRWPKPSFAQVCLRWKKATDLALAYAKANAEDPLFYHCRYEDLVADPKEQMQRIGARFQLDMNTYPFEEINRLGVKGSSEIKQDGKVTWQDQQKPKDFNPVGRWNDWTARQKRIFKRVAGDTLIAGGWAENNDW